MSARSRDDGAVIVNFGTLKPLPEGWYVAWHPHLGMYLGHGPDGWESPISWNRFWVRQWTLDAATARGGE